MVRGFEVFQQHFAGYSDQFTLIGGTATMFAMEDAHLEFRATKDLDIVLHVEAHSPEFVGAFWRFVEDGGYEVRQRSTARTGGFHRFQRPTNPDYPAMLELFSRAPDGLPLHSGAHLTPIPMDDAMANLSAILLDEDYYRFILDGRHVRDGVTMVRVDRLIPLKARAWLDLTARKQHGATDIQTNNIRKHANDIIRLSQLLVPNDLIPVPSAIGAHLTDFLRKMMADTSLEPKAIGVPGTRMTIGERIATAYGIQIGPA
jgi:hypothetical protein